MNHLLIVASADGVSESLLQSLRQAGWRITLTADIVFAKEVLRKGGVAGMVVDLASDHDPERLKILRFVHEFCPNTMLIMLHSGTSSVAHVKGTKLLQTLDTFSDSRPRQERSVSLDLYHLSPAQRRIAELVAQAYPNREIATKLKIKEQSVRNELSRIFKKVGIWNRTELALLLHSGVHPAPENANVPPQTHFKPLPPASNEVETARI